MGPRGLSLRNWPIWYFDRPEFSERNLRARELFATRPLPAASVITATFLPESHFCLGKQSLLVAANSTASAYGFAITHFLSNGGFNPANGHHTDLGLGIVPGRRRIASPDPGEGAPDVLDQFFLAPGGLAVLGPPLFCLRSLSANDRSAERLGGV